MKLVYFNKRKMHNLSIPNMNIKRNSSRKITTKRKYRNDANTEKVKKLESEAAVQKTDFIPPWEQSIDATLCIIQ